MTPTPRKPRPAFRTDSGETVSIGDRDPRYLPWIQASLNRLIERQAFRLYQAEEETYDFSTLTDQELAQEMLREFPELLDEAQRMLKASEAQGADGPDAGARAPHKGGPAESV